jgi:hypothetical protein
MPQPAADKNKTAGMVNFVEVVMPAARPIYVPILSLFHSEINKF